MTVQRTVMPPNGHAADGVPWAGKRSRKRSAASIAGVERSLKRDAMEGM